jgi:uncharacterized protein (UPF0303 family)
MEDSAGLEERIKEIAQQEREIVFDRFTNQDAWNLGTLLVERARKIGAPLIIDITRGDQCLFRYSLEGTSWNNETWVLRKSRLTRRFGKSSFRVGLELRRQGETLESRQGLSLSEYADHGGAFPLSVYGVGVVGAVTVSGLPEEEDHAFVVDGIRAFLAPES